MSVTANVMNFFVAVAMAHDVTSPIGTYNSSSYYDSRTGQYWGEDIFRHSKSLAALVKYGVIEYDTDPDNGLVIRFEDRQEVLSDFARGYADAEAGACIEEGAIDSAAPHAYLSGAQFYRRRSRFGGMAFRLDQGRVCHGVVCEDTGVEWTQH